MPSQTVPRLAVFIWTWTSRRCWIFCGATTPRGAPATPRDSVLSYLPLACACYAIVQYSPTTASVVRRIVGMFGDVPSAKQYAVENGYQRYDVVPATTVIATAKPAAR